MIAPHLNPLPGGEGTSDANFRLFANPLRNGESDKDTDSQYRESELRQTIPGLGIHM